MQLDRAWASIEAGWGTLTALAVTYSFSVIGAIVLIGAGYMGARLVERGVKLGLAEVHGFDATLINFFSQVARYLILVIVLVMVLGQFGVQTASIVAALGAAGLAIGLALQGTLQNIAAGIMLLVLRPFRIGESIKVGVIEGDVEEIGLFATRLRSAEGTYILAPNSKLWNEPVYNTTRNHARRNDVVFNLAYDNDWDAVQAMLVNVAARDTRVRHQPAPIAFISGVTDPSVAVTLRYWTSDKDFLRAKIELTRAAFRTMKEQGVLFPPGSFLPGAPSPYQPVVEPDEEEEEAAKPAGGRQDESAMATRQ